MASLNEQMANEALAAQKFTRKYFVLELDFTERSVEELEAQFDAARYALRGGLTPENIDQLTRLWGAYLGEVLRRVGGGDWITDGEGSEQRVVLRGRHVTLSPHDQVRARLTGETTESIWQYFQQMRSQL